MAAITKEIVKTITEIVRLEVRICGTCGITFGVPETMANARRSEGGGFFCPNGHERGWYDNSEMYQLKRQVQQERQRADQSAADARNAKELLAEKEKETKRLKKRVADGICPCCQRTFKNLSAHMANKHPGFGPSTKANVEADKKQRRGATRQ